MRLIYEKPEDIVAERTALDKACEVWKCVAEKLPMKYELDYLLLREGKGVAWLEIKSRTNTRLAYPTYMISLGKIMAARRLSEASQLPSFLLIQWSDACGYIRIDSLLDFRTAVGGRTDRGDEQDIEPVAMIPVGEFALLQD
jgi:hypothetical protein|tara:strand:+ start:363 stop:788 length:426 start_codon:yes stop_codon:yes gene_type:complete